MKMHAPSCVLGFDGGGTRTRCLVADRSGRILGEGHAGPSNYQVIGIEAAAASLSEAARVALGQASLSTDHVVAACAGLAGITSPEDAAAIYPALSFLPAAHVQLVEDADIALVGALDGAPGAVVISGTGSIALGMDAQGQTIRVGGWGWLLGDEGSGYELGRLAVNAALNALDGFSPATTLGEAICKAWKMRHLREAVHHVYPDLPAARVKIAALVPLVLAAAESGDAVAARLLEQTGEALGNLGATVLRRLALPPEQPHLVAITGGVITECPQVRAQMITTLRTHFPTAEVFKARRSPAEGAITMALRLAATSPEVSSTHVDR